MSYIDSEQPYIACTQTYIFSLGTSLCVWHHFARSCSNIVGSWITASLGHNDVSCNTSTHTGLRAPAGASKRSLLGVLQCCITLLLDLVFHQCELVRRRKVRERRQGTLRVLRRLLRGIYQTSKTIACPKWIVPFHALAMLGRCVCGVQHWPN